MAVKPKIGLLALTLELYENLTPWLRTDRDQWIKNKLLPSLGGQVDIVFRSAVFTRDGIDAEVAYLEAAGVDAICVVDTSYSPSQLALPALSRTRLPIIIWNTQELWAVDESFGDSEMLRNHGVHGTQDLANVLVRSGVKFHYVTSHANDAGEQKQLMDFFFAAAAAERLRRSRLGLLGYPFPGMGDFALDTTHMVATLGCEWVNLSLEDYILRAEGADTASVQNLVKTYRDSYDVAPDVTQQDLEATARVELGLRGMISDNRLDAYSYQFLALGQDERTPTVPFVAACRLMADGIGFGGEGDLTAAAGTSLLNWLQGPATFSEIFTIDFAGNGVFMSHMGEANAAMAGSGKIKLIARPGQITRTRQRQLAMVVTLRPGPATFYALTQVAGGKWRIICSQAEIPQMQPMNMLTPHFKLKVKGDVRDWLTAYAKAGGPHHNAVCFGDARDRIRILADLIGADYVEL